MLNNLSHYFGVVGEDGGLEVAGGGAFCAHAGTGEIGGADTSEAGVDDDGLEVDAGAEDALEAVNEVGVFVEVAAEEGAGLFGVEEADFDVAAGEAGEDFEDGDELAVLVDVEVLEVGGGEPEELLGRRDVSANDFIINPAVGQKGEHKAEYSG